MEDSQDTKIPHSQLDLSALEAPSLFALQLLHRWCLRVVVFSKFPKKPPVKAAPIALPGVLNPLQQMKEANDNILKLLTTNVQESVDFLEKSLKMLDQDLIRPLSECFCNLSAETGNHDLEWERSTKLNLEFVKQFVSILFQ
jgi:hypothetical protein